MVYKWKPGSHIKIPAQTAGEHIDALRNKLGRGITRRDVLDDAKKTSSPLHEAFEWDDSLAAEQYRLAQATHLMNCLVSVHITVRHPKESGPRIITGVRAYHSVVQGDGRGYETTARIMGNQELREQLLAEASAELASFEIKYKQLKELSIVFEAIAKYRKALRTVRTKPKGKVKKAVKKAKVAA